MAALTHYEWRQIDRITYDIYNCSNSASLRGDFLKHMRELIPFKKAFFDLGDSQDDNNFFDPISLDMTDRDLDDYYTHFESLDYSLWVLKQNIPVVYRDTDLLPNTLRENSLIYNEWMKPMDVFFGIGSSIVDNETLFGSITFFRSRDDGDFTVRDLDVLRILNKHLCIKFRQLFPQGTLDKPFESRKGKMIAKYHLTEREYEIMQLLNLGMHNNDISSKLFISDNTTKKHVANIYRKLSVSSRLQLVKVIDKI